MRQVTVSEEIYTQLVAFKQVIEAVIEDQLSFGNCLDLVLAQGLDAMLLRLLGPGRSGHAVPSVPAAQCPLPGRGFWPTWPSCFRKVVQLTCAGILALIWLALPKPKSRHFRAVPHVTVLHKDLEEADIQRKEDRGC